MDKTMTLVLGLCFATLGADAQEPPILCSADPLPLYYRGPVGKVGEHRYVANRVSSGALTFHNDTEKPILNLTLIITYLSNDGQPLLTMAYQAGPKHGREEVFSFERAHLTNELKAPLPPGNSLRLQAESPLTTTRCPSKANVTLLSVVFSDQGTYFWSAPSWHVQATPRDTGNSFNVDPGQVRSVDQFAVRAHITSEGRISALWSLERVPGSLFEAIKSQLSSWSFEPALLDGKSTEDEQIFLLRFHTNPAHEAYFWDTVVSRGPSSPFTVVDFFANEPEPGQWQVVYGDRFLNRP